MNMRLGTAIRDLKRGMTYYPELAKVLGGVCPAVLFCCLSWKDKDLAWESDDGMCRKVRKSLDDLSSETGLTDNEMRGARDLLERVGAIRSNYLRLEHKLEFEISLTRVDELCQDFDRRTIEASVETTDGHVSKRNVPPVEITDGEPLKPPIDHCLENKRENKNENLDGDPTLDLNQDIIPWAEKCWDQAMKLRPKSHRRKFNPGPRTDQFERQERLMGNVEYRRAMRAYVFSDDNKGMVSFAILMDQQLSGVPRNGNGTRKKTVEELWIEKHPELIVSTSK
jgi:hypothetical protein